MCRPCSAAPDPVNPLARRRFDHPDAPPTDLAEAAAHLRVATAHNNERKLALPPPKRERKGQGAPQQHERAEE